MHHYAHATDFGLGFRGPAFRPLLGSGIFTQDGAPWKHSRQLLRPQFATNRSHNFDQVKIWVEALLDMIPNEGGIVNLQPLFFNLTFNTTLFLLFGSYVEDAGGWSGLYGQESEFAQAFNLAQDYLARRAGIGRLYWLIDGKDFKKAYRFCRKFVDEAISKVVEASKAKEKAHALDPEKYVFVDALLAETSDTRVIGDQCMNVLLAGRDSTASALSWTL